MALKDVWHGVRNSFLFFSLVLLGLTLNIISPSVWRLLERSKFWQDARVSIWCTTPSGTGRARKPKVPEKSFDI